MSLPPAQSEQLLAKGFSRRQLGRIAGALTAGAAAFPLFNEFALAQEAERRLARANAEPVAAGVSSVRIMSASARMRIPWAQARKASRRS